MTETKEVKKIVSKRAKKPTLDKFRKLTVSQKAEAAALWRSGTVTLDDLSKKYGKRPENFSRLFTEMGITRGEHAIEAAKKIATTVEARTISELEDTMRKIAETRNTHFTMANVLAKIAFGEVVRAKQTGIDIASLRDVMSTLKICGEVVGNARKELFAVLNVEKYQAEEDHDHLPELTVRELTGNEIDQLRGQTLDDLVLGDDAGAAMLPDDVLEGF